MNMFCSGCGQSCISNAKFCHHCGKGVPNKNENASSSIESCTTSSTNTPRGSVTSRRCVPSFSSFRARKEEERSRFFKPSAKKAKKAKTEETPPTEVKINLGIMVMKDGKLSIKRGATLPLTVSPTITSQSILTKSVEKHSRFNNNLINVATSYRLLYPSMKEVTNLPGTQEQFTLQRYKDEIDKPYSRITFFLCTSDDYIENLTNDSSGASDDEILSHPSFPDSNPASSLHDDTRQPLISSSRSASQDAHDVIIVEETATGASSAPKPQNTIQCPICLDCYPLAEIEGHADTCSMWLLEEDDEPCYDSFETGQDSPSTNGAMLSMEETVSSGSGKELLKQKVSSVAATELSTEEPKRLTVRRKFMYQDFKVARQKNISARRKVKVVFSGEPAVDDGGPRRELFSELLAILKRRFFPNGMPVQSTLAISSGEFKLSGEIMGMSILQGGPAPNFLSSSIVAYLTGAPLLPSNNENPHNKLLGESLANALSDSEVTSILTMETNLDILESIGYTGIPQRETIQTAKAIIQSLCVKDQIGEYLPQVMQIESGLAECGLIRHMKAAPEMWQPLFESGNVFRVSAGDILDQITVDFSISQLAKGQEIDTYKFFCDILEVIDAGEIEDLSLSDFLKWTTGAPELPPLGFSKPISVNFVHGCPQGCNCRPTVSTCDTTIKIPVHINSEQIMKDMLYSAIKDSYGFGNL